MASKSALAGVGPREKGEEMNKAEKAVIEAARELLAVLGDSSLVGPEADALSAALERLDAAAKEGA